MSNQVQPILPLAPVERIIRKAGADRVAEDAGVELAKVLEEYGIEISRKAYALEQKQQNIECEDQEIYRTLGDAVLKTVLIDLLIKSGVNSRGEITSRKKSLEREE